MNSSEVVSTSVAETQKLASGVAKKITHGGVLALHGDLGSGKTTFVQGLAEALGIERRIISPTFIVIRSYELGIMNNELGNRHFYHIDLYRTESEKDLEGLGMKEILSNPSNIVAIEWPEKLGNLLPEKRIDLFFEYVDETKRRILIKQLWE